MHTRSHFWKWYVCGWLLLATMILYMDRLVLTQQEATIRASFGIERDDFYYGLLDSAFSVAFAFGALLMGWLADRWTVWLLYPIVVVLWSIMGGVTGVIEGYGILLICRFLLGFFEAGHWPCALKTSQRILAPSERTLGNGILQSGAAIGSVITPLLLLGFAVFTDSWRPPFLVIGSLGLFWAVGWFFLMRREDLASEPVPPHPNPLPRGGGEGENNAPATPLTTAITRQPADSRLPTADSRLAATGSWLEVLRDSRFWILVGVVISINSTWHFFRVWMPVILREMHGFNQNDVQVFSIAYYVAADLGSLATGFFSVWLVGRGFSVHASRLGVFGLCSILALLSLTALVAPGYPVFLWVLPAVAFASLGLFPPYYSFTQELTVRNQGKVTGTLGFICWMVMAGLRALEGWVSDMVRDQGGAVADRYAFGIFLAAVMPLVALLLLIFFWPREEEQPAPEPDAPLVRPEGIKEEGVVS